MRGSHNTILQYTANHKPDCCIYTGNHKRDWCIYAAIHKRDCCICTANDKRDSGNSRFFFENLSCKCIKVKCKNRDGARNVRIFTVLARQARFLDFFGVLVVSYAMNKTFLENLVPLKSPLKRDCIICTANDRPDCCICIKCRPYCCIYAV